MATDLYATIHKAFRFALSRFLLEVGTTDPGDDQRCAALVERFDALVELLEGHAHHEEQFVHPLIRRVAPNVLERLEAAHGGQEAELERIRLAITDVAKAPPEERFGLLAQVYRGTAAFVASYFAHMEEEELLAQPALTRGFSEEELAATHHALVGSIEPASMVRYLLIMMPAMNVEERVGMLGGMMAAPAPIAEMFLSAAKAALREPEWEQLAARLGIAGSRAAA